jgi:hypothetical protein
MLAIANAHDDEFRWKVAAAVVKHAELILESDNITVEDNENNDRARYAIWHWTEVGEVFARYLGITKGITPASSDDDIFDAVRRSWDSLAAGMPAKE